MIVTSGEYAPARLPGVTGLHDEMDVQIEKQPSIQGSKKSVSDKMAIIHYVTYHISERALINSIEYV